MAFFDDLGKKISQAGQSAVQKTKDITDIARINSMISDEEKNVNNLYLQIGKFYVAIHMNDPEPDLASMVASLRESEARIKDYKQQIQDIKGVKFCDNCGAEVPNNVSFCTSCGHSLNGQQTTSPINPTLIKCIGCGATLDKNTRFCTTCGKPVSFEQPQNAQAPVVETAAEPVVETVVEPVAEPVVEPVAEQVAEPIAETVAEPAPQVQNKYCTNCGAIISEGNAFCTECGTKL